MTIIISLRVIVNLFLMISSYLSAMFDLILIFEYFKGNFINFIHIITLLILIYCPN